MEADCRVYQLGLGSAVLGPTWRRLTVEQKLKLLQLWKLLQLRSSSVGAVNFPKLPEALLEFWDVFAKANLSRQGVLSISSLLGHDLCVQK